jgi:hypothetical protein
MDRSPASLKAAISTTRSSVAFNAHKPDIKWPTNSPTTGTTDTKKEAADRVHGMFETCRRRRKKEPGR